MSPLSERSDADSELVYDDGYHGAINEPTPELLERFDFPERPFKPMVRVETAETHETCHTRTQRVIDVLPELAGGARVVLFITHGSPSICFGRALTGDPSFMPNSCTAGCSRYELRPDGKYAQTWDARADFLTAGAENNWSFDKDKVTQKIVS